MKKTFSGGIHPAEKKHLTDTSSLMIPPEPDRVVIPLRQHIGAACKPLVNSGDSVLIGQKIGDGEGLCVPVHASVSGIVSDIKPMPHPGGGEVPAVIIENNHKNKFATPMLLPHSPEKISPEELFVILREAGITGMGGAAFPTSVKVSSAHGKIYTLIINACECEPYIVSDDMLLRTDPLRVLRGAELLIGALSPRQTFFAVEDNKPEAIAALEAHIPNYPNIKLAVLPAKYPQGSEKQLIRTLTGREVPAGKLPADIGCCVFNPSTVAAVHDAVYLGLPLTRRIVTVSGESLKEPQCFLAPIGMLFSDLIKAAGGTHKEIGVILAGGPMMGIAQISPAVPVIKSTNAILCLPGSRPISDPICIRCGKCIEVCPMYLQPLYLYRSGLFRDYDALEKLHILDCIECGCCSYICPGRLPLVEHFRAGKKAIREASAK